METCLSGISSSSKATSGGIWTTNGGCHGDAGRAIINQGGIWRDGDRYAALELLHGVQIMTGCSSGMTQWKAIGLFVFGEDNHNGHATENGVF
jgi:hypothetical protein